MTQLRKTRDEEERAFQACFDPRTGQLLAGVTRVRVPMRDGMSKDIAQHFAATEAAADSGRQRRQAAVDAYDAEIGERWRDPDHGIGSHGFSGAVAGDLCTVRRGGGRFGPEGAAGTIQLVDGRLECVADNYIPAAAKPNDKFIEHNLDWLSADESDRNAVKDSAYQQYDAQLANAWRRR
jgi:hypothetical protein